MPGFFYLLATLLKKFNLDKNQKFIDFLDEQLIISTQNYVDKTPEFMGALGLTYASDIYYPYGGIHTVNEAIEKNTFQVEKFNLNQKLLILKPLR